MIEIADKHVFSDLRELVDPRHTALVLIDMQRDFVEPDGVFGRLGADLSMYTQMRPRLAHLLDAARERGVTVVHIQMSSLASWASDSPAQLRFNLRMHQSLNLRGMPLQYTEVGTEGHRFVEELTPQAGEFVVSKWRSSGFWGTNLDMLLRTNGIQSVVVTGCTTEGCVESTARDAMFNDYYVVDCGGLCCERRPSPA